MEKGIDIRVPPQPVLKLGEDYAFHFQAFNRTDGSPLTNSTTNCTLHFYNITGVHLIKQNTTFEPPYDFFMNIGGGNFTDVGVISYIIFCQATDGTGGFTSSSYRVNSAGVELDVARAVIYIGLLGILVFIFLATTTGITLLPASNTRDDEGRIMDINNLKYLRSVLWVFTWVLLMAIMFVSSNIALAYLGSDMMGQLFFTFYKVMFIVSVPMLIVWGLYFFVRIIEDKKLKALIERGVGGTL
jgi:hypothetical protein